LGQYELLGEQQMLIRGIYYRRLNNKAALLSIPIYLAASLEGGNVWDDFDDVSGSGEAASTQQGTPGM
jgi:hypothetical protein